MPLKLRVGSGFPFVFPDDAADGSLEPVLFLRILSVDENMEISELRQQYLATKDEKERRDCIERGLQIAVQRTLIEEPLISVLTAVEAWQAINASEEGSRLTTEERKKFALLRSQGTAESAGDAPASDAKTG